MEQIFPIFKELSNIDLNLDSIFLDPNNPRFVNINWDQIPEERYDEDSIQDGVKQKLISEFSINKLINNMEVNGYLPIDRVVVKEFKDGKYVVLEGNRRICAAKEIKNKAEQNQESVDAEILSSVETISCLQYTGSDPEAAWVFQSLRHIMGIQDWSSFNKAKLLVNLKEEQNLSLTEVGKRFGLSAFGAGQWARGYYAFKQARKNPTIMRKSMKKLTPTSKRYLAGAMHP